jgi:tRNA nucleotidyltransferase (CCA-adding enzyme)
MSGCVVTIRPDATLMEAVDTLCQHHLSGAPVVTESGDIVGFVSESELMDVLFDVTARRAPVSEYMTDGTYAVEADDSVASAASLFALYGVRRLPVVENGALVGIVTRRDLLRCALGGGGAINNPLVELIPTIGEYA